MFSTIDNIFRRINEKPGHKLLDGWQKQASLIQ